jgi:spore coat protein CotH
MKRSILVLSIILGSVLFVGRAGALQFSPGDFGFGPPGMDGFGPPGMDGFGPPGMDGFGGRGMGPGGGGFGSAKTKLVKKFDKDGDGVLNAEERKAARASLSSSGQGSFGGFGGRRGGGRGFGPMGFGGMGGSSTSTQGAKLSPPDVKSGGDAPLFDPNTLRTFFLQFEDSDWEKEMEEFYRTDVDVPATLIVDGKTYKDVGVHFRGNTSYAMVSTGQKRPMNISIDHAHKDQTLLGYKGFNWLNASEDPDFLHNVLFSEMARAYIAAPKANFARVVINGESWGIYVNIQQFNKDFTRDFFKTEGGTRWKVPGPNARGGLTYLGDNPDSYKSTYQIKTKDKPEAWKALVALCKTLNQEPAKTLKSALDPILDIDGALKFLALDLIAVNGDGFWTRQSDYSLYLDPKGKFHLIPSDTNETFRGGEGGGGFGPPGMGGFGGGGWGGGFGGRGRGGPGGMMGGGGTSLDPLANADNPQQVLAYKLLSVPELRARYLEIVRDIAEKWLDWDRLGPIAKRYHDLIADDVKADNKKLYSTESFDSGLSSIESFAKARRTYLLSKTAKPADKPEVKAEAKAEAKPK